MFALLDEHRPTALFGSHRHTLTARTRCLVLAVPLLQLAKLDEPLLYTALQVPSYPGPYLGPI